MPIKSQPTQPTKPQKNKIPKKNPSQGILMGVRATPNRERRGKRHCRVSSTQIKGEKEDRPANLHITRRKTKGKSAEGIRVTVKPGSTKASETSKFAVLDRRIRHGRLTRGGNLINSNGLEEPEKEGGGRLRRLRKGGKRLGGEFEEGDAVLMDMGTIIASIARRLLLGAWRVEDSLDKKMCVNRGKLGFRREKRMEGGGEGAM